MVQQLSVFLQNRPGKLAALTRALADGGIDIRALSIADTTDFGILRLLVSDTAKAKRILETQGYAAGITAVTVVAVPDVPGGLARVLTLLADGGVDIEYMYSLIGRGEDKAYMVFRVSDEERLLALLEKDGLATVSDAQLGIR
ncbi:MAG TPA: ACT domain-containing protein [Clostridia bacterium]|nr:ACT domain-containing protein [Clostridia bacterium]